MKHSRYPKCWRIYESIQSRLTDKLNSLDTAFSIGNYNTNEFSSIIDKVCELISDMIDYNKIIQAYLIQTNTPQTRSEIFNKIEPLQTLFDKMVN